VPVLHKGVIVAAGSRSQQNVNKLNRAQKPSDFTLKSERPGGMVGMVVHLLFSWDRQFLNWLPPGNAENSKKRDQENLATVSPTVE